MFLPGSSPGTTYPKKKDPHEAEKKDPHGAKKKGPTEASNFFQGQMTQILR